MSFIDYNTISSQIRYISLAFVHLSNNFHANYSFEINSKHNKVSVCYISCKRLLSFVNTISKQTSINWHYVFLLHINPGVKRVMLAE